MKKILILGVNGFIGHHLSKRILASHRLGGLRHGHEQTERIADLLEQPRFHFFEGDITINKEWIEYHVRKCDVVLPLVAIATPATYVQASRCACSSSTSRPTCRSCAPAVKYKQAPDVPVDLRGLRHVRATSEFDPENSELVSARSTSRAGSTPAPSS